MSRKRKNLEPQDLPLLKNITIEPDVYLQITKIICNELDRIGDLAENVSLEIECKLGRIIDTRTGMRIKPPVLCETIVYMDHVRFESDMSKVGFFCNCSANINDSMSTLMIK